MCAQLTEPLEVRYTPAKTQKEKEDDLLNQLDPFYDAEDEALLDQLLEVAHKPLHGLGGRLEELVQVVEVDGELLVQLLRQCLLKLELLEEERVVVLEGRRGRQRVPVVVREEDLAPHFDPFLDARDL